jgi:hypothetical protein
MLPAQRVEIDAVAVEARDHSEAGEAAFASFRLKDQG